MRLHIKHEISYQFDEQVFLEPHILRLKPQTTPFAFLDAYKLTINPNPSGFSEQIDFEGNMVSLAWFTDLHTELSIVSESFVTLNDFNPFNFIFHPGQCSAVPFIYPKEFEKIAQPYLSTSKLSAELTGYIKSIIYQSNNNTLQFLTNITKDLYQLYKIEYRKTGEPLNPETTFKIKTGSCRDIAWLLIHLLRNAGIAARFVSGYLFWEGEKPEFELHAWVEVFIPGAGWLGIDPTQGIFTNKNYIKLASSSHYSYAMTVTGSYRGNCISNLKTTLQINSIAD